MHEVACIRFAFTGNDTLQDTQTVNCCKLLCHAMFSLRPDLIQICTPEHGMHPQVLHTFSTKRSPWQPCGLQVMLWQRKIELEREMNDVLDPTVGGDVVGAMKREIHRMQLRAAELGRIQESLLLDLERSIAKRDTITLKVSLQQVCI